MLHTLTAACQNDYNCKWLAKHGTVEAAAKLLFSKHSETVFEVLCLLYTMTTEEEARLAMGHACSKSQTPNSASAVEQLFTILSTGNAGGVAFLKVTYQKLHAAVQKQKQKLTLASCGCKARLCRFELNPGSANALSLCWQNMFADRRTIQN